MTDTYEGNGDFSAYNDGSSDFKRKNVSSNDKADEENEETNQINEKAAEYIRELLGERVAIDRKYPLSDKLLEAEISKIQLSGKPTGRDPRYVDIYREKQVRVTVKVLVPVREHPKFNFVGKLLGPKGNSMKRLQEETMCKMAVLGRGSMKDRKREDDLRTALDPKYAHLNDDLHVEISALGPPAEAHARIAYALAEVRKYLIPDNNDIIRQEQLREMLSDAPHEGGEPIDGAEAAEGGEGEVTKILPTKKINPAYSYRQTGAPRSPGPRTVMPAKTKILSILDRARAAMEESHKPVYRFHSNPHQHRYEEPAYEQGPYDGYSYHPSAPPPRSKYEVPEYEPEYRRDYYRDAPSYPVKTSGSPSRPSWKNSAPIPYSSSRGHPHHGHNGHGESQVKHHHSSRDTRYRNSPYTRPSK